MTTTLRTDDGLFHMVATPRRFRASRVSPNARCGRDPDMTRSIWGAQGLEDDRMTVWGGSPRPDFSSRMSQGES